MINKLGYVILNKDGARIKIFKNIEFDEAKKFADENGFSVFEVIEVIFNDIDNIETVNKIWMGVKYVCKNKTRFW